MPHNVLRLAFYLSVFISLSIVFASVGNNDEPSQHFARSIKHGREGKSKYMYLFYNHPFS